MGMTVPSSWRRHQAIAFMTPALVVIVAFVLWPLVQLIGLSFTRWNAYSRIRFDGWDTWGQLFGDGNFHDALRNTLLWTAASAVIPVALGIVFSIAFHRSGRILGPFARAVAIVPLLLPAAVAATTWGIIYNPLFGPLDGTIQSMGITQNIPDWLGDPSIALWAVFAITVWNSVGLTVLIVTAAVRSIGQEYVDSARTEGAGILGELRYVTLAACRRSIALSIVITVVIASQVEDLLLGLNTNGGPDNATLMLPLHMYFLSFANFVNVGESAGEACILIAIVLTVGLAALLLARGSEGMSGEGNAAVPRPNVIAISISLVGIVVLLLPLWWDCVAAFTSGQEAALEPLTSSISDPSLTAFATAWDAGMGVGLWESLVIAAIVVSGALVLSFPAALGLSMVRQPWLKVTLLAVLTVTLLQPGDTFVITLYYLLLQIHLLNTGAGLILAEISRELPFGIVVLWIAMTAVPKDIVAAAEIDAGRGVQFLTRVVAPMIWPAAAAAGLWVFVSSWSEFALPTQLLTTSDIVTAPMALNTFATTNDAQFGLLGAGTLILVVPTIAGLILIYGPAAKWLTGAVRTLTR